jgi:outer membrane protein TolC
MILRCSYGWLLAALCVVPTRTCAIPLDLGALIEEALRENSSLRAFEHRVAAFEARVPRAGAMEDPMIGFEARNLPLSRFDFDSTPMTGKMISVSQAIPLPSLLRARTAIARSEADEVDARLEERKRMVVNQVKQAYFELDFLDRAIDLTRENRRLLDDIGEIAEQQYAVGRGIQADPLRVYVARGMVDDRLLELEASRGSVASRLNLILRRDPGASVGSVLPWTPRKLTWTESDLENVAVKRRGLLAALDRAKDRWEAEADAARRESWPGIRLGVGYIQRAAAPGDPVQGDDFLTVRAGLTIPLYKGRKQKQKEIEARERLAEKTVEREWEFERIRQEIRERTIRIQQHHRQHTLFGQSIVPQSELAMSSALSAYSVGRADLSVVLEAHSALLKSELMNHHHRVAHAKLVAELELTVGADLTREFEVGADGTMRGEGK